jgi:hypothetical protein
MIFLFYYSVNNFSFLFIILGGRGYGAVTQGDVQDSSVFSEIDLLALEHLVRPSMHIGLLGEFEEEAEGLFCDDILGVIQQDMLGE